MPKALSMDLRKRVVAYYESGTESMEYVSGLFHIGIATLDRLMSRKRKTGSIEPKPHAGGNPPKLSGEDLKQLKGLVHEKPDATLAELAETLSVRLHKEIHLKCIERVLNQLKITRKKNSSRSGTGNRAHPTRKSGVSEAGRNP